eukprot:g3709.t1
MRQNQVKMPKCAQEHVGGHLAAEASQEASGLGAAMGKPLLDNAGEDEAVQDESLEAQRLGAAAKKPPLDDAREGQPEETADEETADQGLEVQQDQDASDTKSDPSTVKRKDLLAEVQHLVLLLWAELEQQALENSELSAAARDVCEPERCKLDALETASILCEKLHATFLESLPALAGSELLELTAKVSFDVQAAAMAVQELDKRVMEDRLSVSDSADVDYLIQCASNLKRAARAERAGDVEVVQEQMIKVCKLLLEHMPEKPEKDHLRLALASALPAQLSEEQLQVPGTPFVVDFGFERLCLGIVVPRAAHKTSGNKLTGHARLMEATLKAMGWRVLWAWPDELAGLCQETPDDSVVAALRSAIEEGKSISAARRAAGVGQEELAQLWQEALPRLHGSASSLAVRQLHITSGRLEVRQQPSVFGDCVLLDVFMASGTSDTQTLALKLDADSVLQGPFEGCSFHVFWAKGRGPTLDWVPKEYQLCDLYHALLVEERWSYPALSAVASAVYNGTVQM